MKDSHFHDVYLAVADSLTSLYRGEKVVVIGDEKQLRPSDLFELKEDEYEVDEDIDRTLLSESLLTLANRAFSYKYLKWHYRSAYQELIDFSNHAFYEGRLKIAPNILKEATPIRWIFCDDGVWLDRKNIPEAIRVVDELKNIFITNKINGTNRSVGIITFNYQQRVEIENEIDRRRQKDLEFDKLYSEIDNPETRNLDDLPFVKNIENVQGDERDIIIFSLGYAKALENPEDTIGVQFGALNRQDGENRLNVAITRAKQEIAILCSFDPYKIKADDAEYDGPKRLKDYLCYAKSISELDNGKVKNILSSLDGPKSGKLSSALGERSLEKLVQDRLQKLGYQADLKVGYSDYKIDLAVVHPDNPSRYILAIETDGESFTSAHSTIERDIIRQDFLESRGWRVERIWSRNWWQNSDREITRLQQKIEELRSLDKPQPAKSTTSDIPSEEKTLEESYSTITPETPFSNKRRYSRALETCEEYIHWIDKWFSAKGFDFLADCDTSHIKEIRILTSCFRSNFDAKLRKTFIDFSEEMKKQRGIKCEMRVLKDNEDAKAIHDRWILSQNVCYNLPSPDIVERGQYSEIKVTNYRPPFEDWWQDSLDIATDWNDIGRMGCFKYK